MIEFRLFGSLELRAADGKELDSILSQPKRLALLAYLAVTPGAFHRRDTLVGIFWPELDQQRARAALRQAIYHLRRALGAGVVVGRGDDELGVDPTLLWCDVAAFRTAIAEKRCRDAVELYRGDFLDGLYLEGALEVERWIEEERARLRSAAASAAWSVAESVAPGGESPSAGAMAEAAAWARRAVEFVPDDEASVRRLIEMLAGMGDRAGALRVYRDLERRLEREYETMPSAATQKLIEEVRAAGRRPTLAAGVARSLDRGSEVAAARYSAVTIPGLAVLPFSFRGQPEYAYLGEVIADLLGAEAAGIDELRCVDPRDLQDWLAREGDDLSDMERVRAVGERFGAAYCVLGRIVQSGDRIRVNAALYAVAAPEEPRVRVTSEADVTEAIALANRLAGELLVHANDEPEGSLVRAAARTTESLPALKAYLNGESAYRAGRYTPAAEAFERAIAEDPHFALAHYRLATLMEWAGLPSRARDAAALAVRHSERLALNDRRLMEALLAYFEGDVARSELLYREILAVYPDSTEAWFHLAKLNYFLNPLRGRRLAEAREPLDRAAELDPDDIIVLVHQAIVAAKERRSDDVDTLTRRALEQLGRGDYTDYPLLVRLIRAFSLGDHEEQARLWPELEGANEFTLFWRAITLIMIVGDLTAAGRVAELMLRPSRPGPVRFFGHLLRAELALAHGRWAQAQAELAAAAHLDEPAAVVYRAYFALVHFRDPGPEELRELRTELLAIQFAEAERESGFEPWFVADAEVLSATRDYLLGLIHIRLGELDEAAAYAATLEARSEKSNDLARAAHARDAVRGLRALIACKRGDPEGALACLEACEFAAPMHCYMPTALYGRLHEHYVRAELLSRFDRQAEAVTRFAVLGEDSPHGSIYLAASHLRRAEIHERLGERERAREHYARFVELWRDCDEEFRPLVAAVAARFKRLERPADLEATEPPDGLLADPVDAEPSESWGGGPMPSNTLPSLEWSTVAEPVATVPVNPSTVPSWRRRLLAVAVVILVVGMGLVAMMLRSPADDPIPPRIVVGRIEDATRGDDPSLAPMLESMLATNLARLPGLEVVSEMRILELLAQVRAEEDAEEVGPGESGPGGSAGGGLKASSAAHLLRAARVAGASQVLEGVLYRRIGGGYRLELRRLDLATGSIRAAHAVQGEDLYALADAVAESFAAELGVTVPAPGFADVTTSSLVAYRFYEEGLREYYTGDREQALQLFRAALAEDSTFAMAAYFAGLSAELPESFELTTRAVQFAKRASDRERLLIEAGWAALMDDPRRLALAETLAVRYPAEPAGHHLLGQARLWGGDFLGAIPHLERVIAMDSAGLTGARAACRACDALWDLGMAYTFADSFDTAERVAREWTRAQPGSSHPWIALAYVLEATDRHAEALAAVDSATVRQPGYQGMDIRTGALLRAGDFEEFERLTREIFRVGGPQTKQEVLWSMVLGYRTQGRMTESLAAARELVRYSSLPPNPPAVLVLNRAAEAQTLFEMGRAEEAATLFEASAAVDIASGSTARNARHRAWMLTHAAEAYAVLGDTVRLRILAGSVERLGAQSAYARDQRLHHHIRGLLFRVEGRLEEAEEAFRHALFSPISGYSRTNYELARTLLELGRPEDAVPVLEAALRGPVGASGYYLTRTELHELLGHALEEAGRVEEAAVHYDWARAAWSRGDPEFRRRAAALGPR